MIIKPPDSLVKITRFNKKVFLGGTIDSGNSENWQRPIASILSSNGWTVLNPRRDDWDLSLENSINNDTFYRQVNWELNAMNCADIICLYFAKNSKSPITLLELGLMASSGKVAVFCDKDFWRRGNVEIICEKYNIPFYGSAEYIYHEIDYIYSLVKK